jgi:hypothetical protein
MMKKLALIFSPLLMLLVGFVILHSAPAHASSFDENNLMDDVVFTNANSMNAAQINAWINANFPSSCISTNNGFSAPDPTGYSPSGGFTYGGNVSAGQVIYDAAQAYGLNPEVLLATMQKEQSLVSGGGGCTTLGYAGAMGYGCPDGGTQYNYSGVDLYSINGNEVTSINGTCVHSVAQVGFSQQVIHAAWLLMFGEERSEGNTTWDVQKTNSPESGDVWDNSDDPQSCYGGPMTAGTWSTCPGSSPVYYDGSYTIDGTSIQITNGATAALYWYTPHFSGNQNFDNIFQSWFGQIYGVYSWSVANQYAFTDQTMTTPVDLTNLNEGEKVYVGFQALNTGDTTWYNNGNNPVHAGAADPNDRDSAFCDMTDSPSWLSCNRPAAMTESTVAPGQVGTFNFWYVAPNQPGTYNEHFNLVAEGLSWMNDPGLYFHTIVQPPTYSWALTNQYAYTDQTMTTPVNLATLLPGQAVYIGFQARNTGNVTWSSSGSNPVHAGASSPNDRNSAFCDMTDSPSWLSCNRPAAMSPSSVAPGQVATFNFWYKAPNQPGTYHEYFNPVVEGITWMNNPGMNFYTVVSPAIYSWSMVNQYAYTNQSMTTPVDLTNLSVGQAVYIGFQAKNTGNVSWSSSGSNPVHAGTSNPNDRVSSFCDLTDSPSWLSCNRPAAMSPSSVAPGQVATFNFWYKPSQAGTFHEYFNPVVEGITWMNNLGMNFYTVAH